MTNALKIYNNTPNGKVNVLITAFVIMKLFINVFLFPIHDPIYR